MGEVIQIRQVLESLASGTNSSSIRNCPECGRILEPLALEVFGRTIYVPRTCECQIKKHQQEEAARAQVEKQSKIERLFNLAELGPRFCQCTFETWQNRAGAENCYRVARDYVELWAENYKEGRGLLFFGPPGNGKSHLAAAIVNALIYTQQATCIFRSVPVLLAKLRSAYDESSRISEQEVLSVLRDAELLVLDDFGAEKFTEWAESIMYTIIDDRYRWLRPVIITTNCGLDEFSERIGLRTFDRLLEMCVFVHNSATSYRAELSKERRKGVKTCLNQKN